MESKYQKSFQAERRVLAWCRANPGLVPPPVGDPATWAPLTRQCYILTGIVSQVTDAASEQQGNAVSWTLQSTSEPALLKHLRDEMHVVTQVAQALRNEVPGIGSIKMPPHGMALERFLASADALTQRASTYATVLVEHGLAPDFIAQLQAARSALSTSVDTRGSARASLKRATKQVATSVSLGHKYVALMDAALTKALRNDPPKLAEWKAAKRVVAVRGASTIANDAASMLASPAVPTPAPVSTQVAPTAEVKAA